MPGARGPGTPDSSGGTRRALWSTGFEDNMTSKTRKRCPASQMIVFWFPPVPDLSSPHWTFLARHAQVLLCIADDPAMRLPDLGVQGGIAERPPPRIGGELIAPGDLPRQRQGRRNPYSRPPQLPLPD